ncbi:MAG: alginate lyase family protein [Methylococcaceae bacterium]|nr:alginate lyase family protein [Methylococcaceae bacterium]
MAVNSFPGQGQNNPLSESIAALSEAELIVYFANRSHVVYPDLPKASDEQLKNAADILANRFSYTGETFQFEPVFSWKPNPSADKEWQIAFHKHYFLIDLIQAYRHTREVVYLEKWKQLIQSWITEMGSGYITLSDAQVEAKRMESWCIAFMLLKGTQWHDHIPGCFLQLFLSRIAEETHYISQHLKPVRNHRTFQLYAIYLVGVLFPELTTHSSFLETGTDLLSKNLLTDFQRDGVHIEMSSHYHQLVAETGIRMLELAVLNKISLNNELVDRLHKAVRFSLYLQWPNGDIPLINDSDNGNHLDLLRLGSHYFNDPELLWGATLGADGRAPDHTSYCFTESGYFILSDTWGSDKKSYAQRQHVFFDCGNLGEGSHSHYDLFNFCYFLGGQPAIIDPGRYTYSGEPDTNGTLWRHYFKGTAAHNTVTIDRLDQTRYLNRTKHGPDVQWVGREYLLGQKSDWVFGRAVSENYSPQHERLFVYVGHEYLFILDKLHSDDLIDHHYELNFHLPAGTESNLISQEGHYRLVTNQCEIRGITELGMHCQIKPGWVSQYYGIKHQAPILSVNQSGSGDKIFTTLVAPLPNDSLTINSISCESAGSNNQSYSVGLIKQDQHYYDRFIIPASANELYQQEGLHFQGKFLAYREDGEGKILFVTAKAASTIVLRGKTIHNDSAGSNVEWIP